MLISAVGSTGTGKPVSWPDRAGGTVMKALVNRFQESLPPLNA